MPRENLNDLLAFLAVARERSFTKAAAKLGVSPSALSHTLGALEARLGVRLLHRTTRSVAPTQAGERLRRGIGPRFEEIKAELAALGALRDKPAGTIRLTATDYATRAILLPTLAEFLPRYPDVTVEIGIDNRLVDIVAEGFDAGVRDGEQIARDMIAVRIGPNLRMAVVGAPAYFAERSRPKKPQDLTEHNCINLRLPTRGGLYAWEFQKGTRKLNVHVEGQFVCNHPGAMLDAALAGLGIAYVLEDAAKPYVDDGRLERVLGDWCPVLPGYHLYYPSRRQTSPAFTLLVDALRRSGHQPDASSSTGSVVRPA
ncbi:MAG: LysR family transcriptional regulator [Burkholderiaceae bacterium]|nr:MAG: LysR family transcriptional regulator [Burkholderiaceae bacterium]